MKGRERKRGRERERERGNERKRMSERENEGEIEKEREREGMKERERGRRKKRGVKRMSLRKVSVTITVRPNCFNGSIFNLKKEKMNYNTRTRLMNMFKKRDKKLLSCTERINIEHA